MSKFKIGCDPEFFFIDKDGKLVSAIPHVEGTKDMPQEMKNGGNIQRDNVAVEIGTIPAESREDFVKQIGVTLKDLLEAIPEHLDIVAIPSANFDEDQLDHPEAKRFGCDPDFCAWDLIMIEKPECATTDTFRSCGGHIHVGFVADSGNDFLLDEMGKVHVVRMMDLVHGTISTLLDRSEEAVERRKLYGKAGCHRPTTYGVEYRVLSNFWCKSPFLVSLMYSLTNDVLKLIRDNRHEELIELAGSATIRTTINNGNVEDAKHILDNVLMAELSDESKELFEECLANVDTYDFKKEWKLSA